jgi:lysophospholipase L1-like esterase
MRLWRVAVAALTTAVLGFGVMPAHAAPVLYVALGDSYASGPIIPAYERPFGCLRSTNNYAHVIARQSHYKLLDASCAGAETEDMTHTQGVRPGPNPPQFDRLNGNVAVVTLQIGGNDIGFSSIATDCFAPVPQGTPCQDAYGHGPDNEISHRIAAAAPLVSAAIAGAKARAFHARVYVLGYPSIVPDSDAITATAACWPQLPVSPEDLPWLRDITKQLNAMIASAAAANGVRYVDVYGPSVGHDSCQPPGIRWVEPLVIVGPAAPVHPNALGMLQIAQLIKAAIAHP